MRNERSVKIFNFDDGAAIEPDFILFLVKKESIKSLQYQIFIEPKGGHLLKQDEWKENFLKRLKAEHKIEQLWEGKEFVVWGMPFYNEMERKTVFEKEFNSLIKT